MEHLIQKFREQVTAELGDRRRAGRCYSETLKHSALHIVGVGQKRRVGLVRVAKLLGVHPTTLRDWIRAEAATKQTIVPVRVVEEVAVQHPVVIAGPLRIEGLDVAGIAELLRRLD